MEICGCDLHAFHPQILMAKKEAGGTVALRNEFLTEILDRSSIILHIESSEIAVRYRGVRKALKMLEMLSRLTQDARR